MTKDASHINEKVTYTRARWGGSFWHHDVEEPAVRDAFERRIRRLLGMLPDVPAWKARVFIRTVSSTLELDLTLELYEALKDALPECRIFLLMMVDLQETEELLALESRAGLDVLFFRVHEHILAAYDHQQEAENYARGVACAIRVWAGVDWRPACMASLVDVSARCDQMDSGDPGSEGLWPRRFRGQRLGGAPIRVPRLFERKEADFVIPDGVGEGNVLTMNAFGIDGLQTAVPPGGVAGQVIRLRKAEGMITAALLVTVTVARTPLALGPAAPQVPSMPGALQTGVRMQRA